MNIHEALEALERIYDSNVSYMDHYEAEEFCNALEAVYQFIQKHELRKELPEEFTCTCGEHLVRFDIYAGMSRFFCSVCESEWLVGPQEV